MIRACSRTVKCHCRLLPLVLLVAALAYGWVRLLAARAEVEWQSMQQAAEACAAIPACEIERRAGVAVEGSAGSRLARSSEGRK